MKTRLRSHLLCAAQGNPEPLKMLIGNLQQYYGVPFARIAKVAWVHFGIPKETLMRTCYEANILYYV